MINKYPRPKPDRAPLWPLFASAAAIAVIFVALIALDPMARVTACAVQIEDVK